MTSSHTPSTSFGLIVIGDEVLNGSRSDAHLDNFKAMLGERGHSLAWYWLLPDDPASVRRHLAQSMQNATPVFSCGGIGATPDDPTRACAAAAAGVPLTRHPRARRLIEERFGEAAYPHRILMADLPEGSELIPNPKNRIPGFSIHNHWFLPGFPDMAEPMARWVLDKHFGRAEPLREDSLRVLNVPESRLIPIMRAFAAQFPDLKMFSLPHMGTDPHILLGFRGREGLAAAMQALRHRLRTEQMPFDENDDLI